MAEAVSTNSEYATVLILDQHEFSVVYAALNSYRHEVKDSTTDHYLHCVLNALDLAS